MACEGRASGVSCHIRRPIWQPIGYPAAPTHPPHAIGTRAPLGDQNTSIEASFYFSVQRSLKYPHVRPQMQGVLSTMGGCLGCFGRSRYGPVPSGRGNSASRWPLQLRLGDRRHAHMSSSDAEFQRKRPAGRAAIAEIPSV